MATTTTIRLDEHIQEISAQINSDFADEHRRTIWLFGQQMKAAGRIEGERSVWEKVSDFDVEDSDLAG